MHVRNTTQIEGGEYLAQEEVAGDDGDERDHTRYAAGEEIGVPPEERDVEPRVLVRGCRERAP